MQSAAFSNRFIIGIVAFGISFGLSLVLNGNFGSAFFTALITVSATYLSVLFTDKRRRNHEMIILDSLKRHIREMESVKSGLVVEINQLEAHRSRIYGESKQIQHQLTECRHQRDSINRELSTYAGQKKQFEAGINNLRIEINNLEKTKEELDKSFSVVVAEKRRLELSCNSSRTEANKLKNNIENIIQEKEELENNLTLLKRLKPPLDEKLNQLRSQIQELELQGNKYTESISQQHKEKGTLEECIKSLRKQLKANSAEKSQLENQTLLLQDERDLLQNQVWELLQQIENLNPETTDIALSNINDLDNNLEKETEPFPFSELLEDNSEIIEKKTIHDSLIDLLPPQWEQLQKKLSECEMQVLQAIVEQDNPHPAIKEICEENITMPSLLIDSINGLAKDNINELIIDTNDELPKVYDEYLGEIKIMINNYVNGQINISNDVQTNEETESNPVVKK
ncbi:MAG: tellurite resistance TerB C-terminal domain-containing protein [Mastigocoleus sp.]